MSQSKASTSASSNDRSSQEVSGSLRLKLDVASSSNLDHRIGNHQSSGSSTARPANYSDDFRDVALMGTARGSKTARPSVTSDTGKAAVDSQAPYKLKFKAAKLHLPGLSSAWSDAARLPHAVRPAQLAAESHNQQYYGLRHPDEPAALSDRAKEILSGMEYASGAPTPALLLLESIALAGNSVRAMLVSNIDSERREAVHDIQCEDWSHQYKWQKIEDAEIRLSQVRRLEDAAVTTSAFTVMCRDILNLSNESATDAERAVHLGCLIPIFRMLQQPPSQEDALEAVACVLQLVSSDKGRQVMADFGGYQALCQVVEDLCFKYIEENNGRTSKEGTSVSESTQPVPHQSKEKKRTTDKQGRKKERVSKLQNQASSVSLVEMAYKPEGQAIVFMLKGCMSIFGAICSGAVSYREQLIKEGGVHAIVRVLHSVKVPGVIKSATAAMLAVGWDAEGHGALNPTTTMSFVATDRVTTGQSELLDETRRAASAPQSGVNGNGQTPTIFEKLPSKPLQTKAAVSFLDTTRPSQTGQSSEHSRFRPTDTPNDVDAALADSRAGDADGTMEHGAPGGTRSLTSLSGMEANAKYAAPSSLRTKHNLTMSTQETIDGRMADSVFGANSVATKDISMLANVVEGGPPPSGLSIPCSQQLAAVGSSACQPIVELLKDEDNSCSTAVVIVQLCAVLCLLCRSSSSNRMFCIDEGIIGRLSELLKHEHRRVCTAAAASLSLLAHESKGRTDIDESGCLATLVQLRHTPSSGLTGGTGSASLHAYEILETMSVDDNLRPKIQALEEQMHYMGSSS